MQLAATLGFISNSHSGKFLGLIPEEKEALHECLAWLRQPGNNRLCFYGAELEAFDAACKRPMQKVRKTIPEALYFCINICLNILTIMLVFTRGARELASVRRRGPPASLRTGRWRRPLATRRKVWLSWTSTGTRKSTTNWKFCRTSLRRK